MSDKEEEIEEEWKEENRKEGRIMARKESEE